MDRLVNKYIGKRMIVLYVLIAIGILIALALTYKYSKLAGPPKQIVQAPLPYEPDALEPYISEKTMQYHYGKHHAGYVAKANRLLADSAFTGKTDVEIMKLTAGKEASSAIFNNVAQAWNHAFFWQSMKPEGGGEPEGLLAEKIAADFGDYETFKEQFVAAAKARFGSGWVWLVKDGDHLKIMTTANADTPMAHGIQPLLCVDVWEHAYYLDYQNARGGFVEKVLDHLINWKFAAGHL